MRTRSKLSLLVGAPAVFAAVTVGTSFVCPPVLDLEINQVRAMVSNTSDAVIAYRSSSGHLPTNEEGLTALLQPMTFGPFLKWMPTDPWGSALVYRRSTEGDAFSLYSRGRNGVDELGGGDDV